MYVCFSRHLFQCFAVLVGGLIFQLSQVIYYFIDVNGFLVFLWHKQANLPPKKVQVSKKNVTLALAVIIFLLKVRSFLHPYAAHLQEPVPYGTRLPCWFNAR